MDGKRAAPRKGRRVVFWGGCTCRAGPMCPAAGYAFFGGARGPRPTGCGGHPGRTESSAPTRQNRSRAKRNVEDAVPYDGGHEPCETGLRGRRPLHTLSLRGAKRRGNPFSPARKDGFPRRCVPQGHLLRGAHWRGMTARCAVGTSRTPSPTKSQGMCAMGGRRHPPLQGKTGTAQNGTAGTPSPTHSVPRWERRDTWVPPYEVRRSSRADRVVRPYKAEQEPREAGRRGRRPLQGLSARERAAPVGAALFFIVIAPMRR